MKLKNRIFAAAIAAILAVALTGCDFLAADPKGRFVYSADEQYLYVLGNPDSGVLSPLHTEPITNVLAITPHPNGDMLYVLAATQGVDPNTGFQSTVLVLNTYAVHESGSLMAVASDTLGTAPNTTMMEMVALPAGDALLVPNGANSLFIPLDISTSLPNPYNGGVVPLPEAYRLVAAPGGNLLYGLNGYAVVGMNLTNPSSSENGVFETDPIDGASFTSMFIEETGRYVIALGTQQVAVQQKPSISGAMPAVAFWFEINQETGRLTLVNQQTLGIAAQLGYADARGKFAYLFEIPGEGEPTVGGRVHTYRFDTATQTLVETAVTAQPLPGFPSDFVTLGKGQPITPAPPMY